MSGRAHRGWPGVPLDPVLACICGQCDPPKHVPGWEFAFLDENGEGKEDWKPPCNEYTRPHNMHIDIEIYCAKCGHPRKCHSPYRERYANLRESLKDVK